LSRLSYFLYSLKDWVPTSWRKGLVTVGLAGAIGLSGIAPTSCLRPNEIDKYTRQLNLPKEDRAIVRQLGYDGMDEREKALINEYNSLLTSKQLTGQSLIYFRTQLKSIAEDKKASDDELDNFKDPDADGLTNQDELKYETDLIKPNPNVKYSLDKNLAILMK